MGNCSQPWHHTSRKSYCQCGADQSGPRRYKVEPRARQPLVSLNISKNNFLLKLYYTYTIRMVYTYILTRKVRQPKNSKYSETFDTNKLNTRAHTQNKYEG
ncbi:hypothetical protein V1478_010705 [Vespula squamosa]|uniref:Uncharacterized protein n=1 Tax=Vespula squamosa TaxID=30214 RepID=A0ABD2AIJ6_VESSQ